MNRINNFYDSQIIDRELNKPSFFKILFSDYGKVEIYEKSRWLFLTSFITGLINGALLGVLIILSIIFLLKLNITSDLFSSQFLSTFIVFIIITVHASYNFFTYLIGFTFKKAEKILKTKLSFDNLFSNFLIRLAVIIMIIIFTLPIFTQDPLIPITHTYALNLAYMNNLLNAIISLLVILLFMHLDVIIIGYFFKNKTVKKSLHELKLKIISVPGNKIPVTITKEYINSVLFQVIKKK